MSNADVAASVSEPKVNWKQVAFLTAGAVGLFVAVRALPTGTNLNHMDFRATGKNVIEFCDPTNPQFIPVVNVKSPVEMKVWNSPAEHVGSGHGWVMTLKTASGKPIGPADLAVMHTQKLHLLVIDPSLVDYQHVHGEPTRTPGEWTFKFDARRQGLYRIFADFTPVATGRGLYAHADVQIGDATRMDRVTLEADSRPFEQSEYQFELWPGPAGIRAGQQADLRFSIARNDRGPVSMGLVMGAYAHLVAFDDKREGFAHLHPVEADPTKAPDPVNPVLNFKITIPKAGRYVIWAQTNIGGKEMFAPFWFTVAQ